MSLDEALGIWAEAAQDMASASLAFAAGNYYNCADLANQVAEKALQAVYVLRNDSRAAYPNHDLAALGVLVQAPPDILNDLRVLSDYHPELYLANRLPEQADDEIGPDTAQEAMTMARGVLRWARQFVLTAY